MAIVNPISLATKGVLSKGGNISHLGLATIGVLNIDNTGVPAPDTGAVRRTTLLTLMSGTRR